MAQIKNNSGDIKVIKVGGGKDDGSIKWFSPSLANNERLMGLQGYEIAEAPELHLPQYVAPISIDEQYEKELSKEEIQEIRNKRPYNKKK